ncbi:MAG: tetrahydromethanopterin S-methyltransferase subunit MtrG [Methermicoccaceae archaeon]
MDQSIVPHVVVDQGDYKNLVEKIESIEDRIEFFHSELAQRYGKRVGRDIGILYGLTIGTIMFLVFLMVRSVLI